MVTDEEGEGREVLLRHLLRQGYSVQEGYSGQVGDLRLEIGGGRFGIRKAGKGEKRLGMKDGG